MVDPRINCETLGLAFEEKNRRKLSISLRKSRRMYSHIFLNLYITYLSVYFFLSFCRLEILLRTAGDGERRRKSVRKRGKKEKGRGEDN